MVDQTSQDVSANLFFFLVLPTAFPFRLNNCATSISLVGEWDSFCCLHTGTHQLSTLIPSPSAFMISSHFLFGVELP